MTNFPTTTEDVDYHVAGNVNGRYVGKLVGHVRAQVTEWLEANPSFDGSIYADRRDGGEDVDVTDTFMPPLA